MSRRKRGTRPVKERLRRILERLARKIGLPTAPVVALAEQATPARFEAGDTIFAPRDLHTFSYVLIEGAVRLECADHRGRRRTIQLVGEGRLFGVSWLPRSGPRAIRAVAHTDAVGAVIDQDTMGRLVRQLSHRERLNLLSYATRVQSGLVVQKAAEARLPAEDRLVHAMRGLVPAFGRHDGGPIRLGVPLTCTDLGMLAGASQSTVRHLLGKLRRRRLAWRDGGGYVLPAGVPGREEGFHPEDGYRGTAAEWARPTLADLLGRCGHFGIDERGAEFICRTAALYAVPDGELVLPRGSHDAVAFVVAGSAWLEAADPSGEPFVLQLVPPGHFVRLPTGASSRGIRMRGRAHRSCVVGLLTFEQMAEAMSLLPVEGQLKINDATSRGFSRQLCDCTTAPTRPVVCRLLTTFGFLARDFPRRAADGILVDVPLSRADLAHHVGVDPTTISKAADTLERDGWIGRPARDRYALLRRPPGDPENPHPCPYCNG